MQQRVPSVEFRLTNTADSVHTITIASATLSKNLRIEIENEDVEVDDNFFDIDAGVPKVVRIISHLPQKLIKERLRLRAL
jgi:hypothetical protein